MFIVLNMMITFLFYFQETYNNRLRERYRDDTLTHPEFDPDLWMEVGSSGVSHPPESSTSRRHFLRSGDLMLGSFCREKGSRHLVLRSLGNLTGLSEILRQGTGCVKGRF